MVTIRKWILQPYKPCNAVVNNLLLLFKSAFVLLMIAHVLSQHGFNSKSTLCIAYAVLIWPQ